MNSMKQVKVDYDLYAYEYYTNRKGDSVTSQYTAGPRGLPKVALIMIYYVNKLHKKSFSS